MGEIDKTYGAALIGVCSSLILYGVTNLQTFVYACSYPQDTIWNKLAVFWLWLLDTVHVVVCIYMMYWYLITNYGNPDELLIVHWTFEAIMILTAIVVPSVQVFYAIRVCKLDATVYRAGIRRPFRPITVVTIMAILAGIAAALTVCYENTRLRYFSRAFLPSERWTTYYPLATTTCVDLQVAAALCYLLSRCRTDFQKTNTTVTWLMFYIVNTGFLTSICSLTAVIMIAALPGTFCVLTFEFIMTKLYINSYLAMINARTALRNLGDEPQAESLQNAFQNTRMKVFNTNTQRVELNDTLADRAGTSRESGLHVGRSADAKMDGWEEQYGDALWTEISHERCGPTPAIARKPLPVLSRKRQSITDTLRMSRGLDGNREE